MCLVQVHDNNPHARYRRDFVRMSQPLSLVRPVAIMLVGILLLGNEIYTYAEGAEGNGRGPQLEMRGLRWLSHLQPCAVVYDW